MKQETIFRAVGEVGDDLIARADAPVQKHKTIWLRWAAMAACCALIIGAAAFAGLVLHGAKSSAPETAMQAYDTDTTNTAEAPRSTDSETCAAAENSTGFKSDASGAGDGDFESPAESVPEEPESEAASPADQALPSDAPEEAYSFCLDGIRYVMIPADGVELLPGEPLGTVEESDFPALVGCQVYACDGAEPSYRVLLLLDGAYLPFQNAASDSAE